MEYGKQWLDDQKNSRNMSLISKINSKLFMVWMLKYCEPFKFLLLVFRIGSTYFCRPPRSNAFRFLWHQLFVCRKSASFFLSFCYCETSFILHSIWPKIHALTHTSMHECMHIHAFRKKRELRNWNVLILRSIFYTLLQSRTH